MNVKTEKDLVIFGSYVEQQGYYWRGRKDGGRIFLAKHFPWKRESDKWILEISTEKRKVEVNGNESERTIFVAKGYGYPVSVQKLIQKFKEFVGPFQEGEFEFSFASDDPCEPVSYMY